MAEYIERGALMQFPIRRDHYDRKNGNKHFINGIETVLEYAENLPAADVATVRHGRWNVVEGRRLDNAICSNCGRHFQAYYEGYSFCPNCGAKMDGGADDVHSDQ